MISDTLDSIVSNKFESVYSHAAPLEYLAVASF